MSASVSSPAAEENDVQPDAQPKIGTSVFHWFVRGLFGGIMLIAAINAISYFFLSEGLANLIGRQPEVIEVIGFPFEVWREGASYGTSFVDYWGAVKNLAVGLVLGLFFGWIGIALRPQFNQWVADFEAESKKVRPTVHQFSLKSILFWTTVVAMFAALMTRWNGTSEGLFAIYLLGPLTLIWIAMFPDHLHWTVRAVILSILAFALIGIALRSGSELGMPLDRIMLGFFVSWTPQSVFAAFLITLGLVYKATVGKMNPRGNQLSG
ncbi:MAG: hypothetical protein AAFN77_03445 [Planctomycetota bacterium]